MKIPHDAWKMKLDIGVVSVFTSRHSTGWVRDGFLIFCAMFHDQSRQVFV